MPKFVNEALYNLPCGMYIYIYVCTGKPSTMCTELVKSKTHGLYEDRKAFFKACYTLRSIFSPEQKRPTLSLGKSDLHRARCLISEPITLR